MTKNSLGILQFIHQYSNLKRKAETIKEDEEKQRRSVYFGMSSIIYSIFAVLFCILGAWLFHTFLDSALIIFTIIIGIALMLCGAMIWIWSMIHLRFQFRINHNWSAWVALIFLVGAAIAGVMGILLFLQ